MPRLEQLIENASDHADELTEVLGAIELQVQRETEKLKSMRQMVVPTERAETLGS